MLPSNSQGDTTPGADFICRADVDSNGDVTLVTYPPSVEVSPHRGTVQSISLTVQQYVDLHAMFAAPDLKLMYVNGEFTTESIGSVS